MLSSSSSKSYDVGEQRFGTKISYSMETVSHIYYWFVRLELNWLKFDSPINYALKTKLNPAITDRGSDQIQMTSRGPLLSRKLSVHGCV